MRVGWAAREFTQEAELPGPWAVKAHARESLFAVRATQPIYSGERIKQAVRGAELAVRAADLAWSAAEVQVTAAVAHGYDDLLLARELVLVAEQSARVLEEAVRVDGGLP